MRKLNVLLVDDSPLFLKPARELLAASDCVDRIDCANSLGKKRSTMTGGQE
jgi:hypothetical protein